MSHYRGGRFLNRNIGVHRSESVRSQSYQSLHSRRSGVQFHRDTKHVSNDLIRRQYRATVDGGGVVHLSRSIDNRQSNVEWTLWRVLLGAKYDRVWLLNHIQESLSFTIVPFNVQNDQQRNVLFYCKLTRSQIREANTAVSGMQDPQQRTIVINITSIKEPFVPNLQEAYAQEKVKVALQKRYRPSDQHIDLSEFSQDESLKASNLYVPLNRTVVIDFICEALIENLIQLRSLDISGNAMSNITAFMNFFRKFDMLTRVNLSRNRLRSLDDLAPLIPCAASLEYLDLSENLQLQTRNSMARSTLRRMFPVLKRLGNEDILPSDARIDRRRGFPPSQVSYFVNPNLKSVLMPFIAEYLTTFDTNRRDLLRYYSQHSIFTLHCGTHSLVSAESNRLDSDMLNIHNRNLLHVRDFQRRKSAIKQGDIQIVAFIETLPGTKHHLIDNGTFHVEVPFQSESFMLLHFDGVYDESPTLKAGSRILRSYSCNMLIVPPLTIMNHDLLVTNPSLDVINKARHQGTTSSTPSMPNAMSVGPPPSIPSQMSLGPSAIVDVPPGATQQNLVRQLMQATGMNEFFAQKCLADLEWNYNAALSKFIELKDGGLIPNEAFCK